MSEYCLVVDFGSQYTQLIARKLRELGVRSQVVPPEEAKNLYEDDLVKGIILSGGPASVSDKGAPQLSFDLERVKKPVLGLCYGMQLIAKTFGGVLGAGESREYGVESIDVKKSLLFNVPKTMTVLMSHGDHVKKIPDGFVLTAISKNKIVSAFENEQKKIFGFQFHPEVHHTENGIELLQNFLKVCGFSFDWKPSHIFEEMAEALRTQVGEARILCGLSGGVDSSVVAVVLNKLFPGRVDCICVDTGVMRKNEIDGLTQLFSDKFKFPIKVVDASQEFLSALKGVGDPEEKRKKIGHLFIEIFERESKLLEGIKFLAQGTLYPDVIESISPKGGPSVKIKSHHNVGGLPERLPFDLVEPLRDLFKDEVRRLGEFLGMPHEFVWRHPFPGPGLAVRIIGEVTPARVKILQEADERLQEVLREFGWYEKLWQSFCVFLPVQSVGVMGDQRTYEEVIAVRCVHSEDGMTASIAAIPTEILQKISSRIINEVKGVNRVVYDISSKPPSTIEWE